MQDLGTLGGNSSSGDAVNDHAQVTGYSSTNGGGDFRGFLWTARHMRQTGTTFGGPNTFAYAVNDLGVVVGQSDLSGPYDYHAFIWLGGQILDLNAGDHSAAFGINDRNEVVGVSGELDQTPKFGFLWRNRKSIGSGVCPN
jgi:probable HAF family extracellular repeat protein